MVSKNTHSKQEYQKDSFTFYFVVKLSNPRPFKLIQIHLLCLEAYKAYKNLNLHY